MNEILQGTTPTLEIAIDTDDFLVSSVTKLEFTIWHNSIMTIHGLEDVEVDTEANSFKYKFTEAETLAMIPKKPLYYQLRFMFSDGTIVGTRQMSVQVTDLYSEETMTE